MGRQSGDVSQLSAWSVVRGQAGFVPRYVPARRSGQLVGGGLVLQRRLPVLGIVEYVPNGPVIAPEAERAAVADAVSTAVAGLGGWQLSGLFVQPPDGADDVSEHLLRLGFRPSVAGIARVGSMRVDPTRAVEDIRDGLSSSNRRRTPTWADRGVTVRLVGRRDLPLLAESLARTATHQHCDPVSLDYLRNDATRRGVINRLRRDRLHPDASPAPGRDRPPVRAEIPEVRQHLRAESAARCAGAGAARGSTPPSPGGCLTQAGVATVQPPDDAPTWWRWRW
jgi:hypothetical protein